jgi:hypothetical protein
VDGEDPGPPRAHAQLQGRPGGGHLQPCEAGGVGGIALYDVTNPRHPRELAVFENGIQRVHELWMQVRGKRVYVYQATIFEEIFQFFGGLEPGNPDFRVIDVSDPRNPEQVGQWGAWEELDIVPTAANGSFPFNFVHSMIGNEDGDRVYLSYWDIGTVILDMSDPTDPEFIGRTSFGYTRIFDISRESRPQLPEGPRRHAVPVPLRRGRRGPRHRSPVAAAPARAVRAAADR